MDISVVILSFNSEKHIGKCLTALFLGDEDDNVYGGCYIFKDAESLEAYKKGPIFEFLSTHENFDNFTTKEHNVIDGPSIIAGAKTDTIG